MARLKSLRKKSAIAGTALALVVPILLNVPLFAGMQIRFHWEPVVGKKQKSNSTTAAKTTTGSHVFPRWGEEGIDVSSLSRYIDQTVLNCIDGRCVERDFAFTLYVVDADAVWTSRTIRKRNPTNFLRSRVSPTERIFERARQELMRLALLSRTMEDKTNSSDSIDQHENHDHQQKLALQQQQRWPLLLQELASSIVKNPAAISSSASVDIGTSSVPGNITTTSRLNTTNATTTTTTKGIGFPFIAWYGDFTGCNHRNWRGNESIPIFSTCARVTCSHGFPTPTYATYKVSKEHVREWDKAFAENERQYPWKRKIPQVVWRGSLSGKLKNYTSFRWRIATFDEREARKKFDLPSSPGTLQPAASTRNQDDDKAMLLNIGINRIPARHKGANINVSALNAGRGLVPSINPMSAFQKYKAILDIDGNSWSSRFGALLCYNSVILKVEPEYIDYFYRYLQPWYHYIPVRADLSDLLEKAAYVMNPTHEYTVRQIIGNANAWCREHMVRTATAHDVLDIWEVYLQYLQKNSPNWRFVWEKQKEEMFRKADQLDIVSLEEIIRRRG